MTRDNELPHLLQGAVDGFLERTRALAEMMAGAGPGALGALPEPVPRAVSRMLSSLAQVAEQMPPVTAQLDVLIQEVHAKRQSIQALQAELAVLDRQLEVFERSLAPVEAWSTHWNRLRQSLTETLGGDVDHAE
ncbi:hypothetical protein [Nocardioides pacificus]